MSVHQLSCSPCSNRDALPQAGDATPNQMLDLGMWSQFVQEKFPDHGVLGEEGGIMGTSLACKHLFPQAGCPVLQIISMLSP